MFSMCKEYFVLLILWLLLFEFGISIKSIGEEGKNYIVSVEGLNLLSKYRTCKLIRNSLIAVFNIVKN